MVGDFMVGWKIGGLILVLMTFENVTDSDEAGERVFKYERKQSTVAKTQ